MLIGIYSSTPQSGKSTVADYLRHRHWFSRYPFAGPLKAMASGLVRILPFREDDLYDSDKSQVVYQDKTLRHLLQTLGTEWGRKCMGENFWVDIWSDMVRREMAAGYHVVVDDMRFPNEMDAVEALGGWTWKITRPGAESPTLGHTSEGALDGRLFDTELVNDSTLSALETTIEMALRAKGRNDVSKEAIQAQR